MKSIWSYGNVFLMGVATTLLWVKWTGRWNVPQQYTVNSTTQEVSVPEMVAILKTPEAVEKLRTGHTPKFKDGKMTGWEPAPLKETLTNASVAH